MNVGLAAQNYLVSQLELNFHTFCMQKLPFKKSELSVRVFMKSNLLDLKLNRSQDCSPEPMTCIKMIEINNFIDTVLYFI